MATKHSTPAPSPGYVDIQSFTWDDLLAGESKAERDAAISDGRRTRQSPERTTMLLCFLQMGVGVQFHEAHPLLSVDSTTELAEELIGFHLTLGGRDEKPFDGYKVESVERALNRNIQAGLIVKHDPWELIDEEAERMGIEVEKSIFDQGYHHISETGMGYLIAHDVYDCYAELRRYILTDIIEELPSDPEVWDVEGMYGTDWQMGEKTFNDLNHGQRAYDHDLIGDSDKIAELASAIADKDWKFVWTTIDRKDEFVRQALFKLNYTSKIMEMSLKTIDPTRKGGQKAAPRIRDELAEHWEETFDNNIVKAKIYVEEMILRSGYMTLRATLDQQTGLSARAKQFKKLEEGGEYQSEEVSYPRLTRWIADLANAAWEEISRREDELELFLSEQDEEDIADLTQYRKAQQASVDRFNQSAEQYEKVMQMIPEDQEGEFWRMFDMDVRLLDGGVAIGTKFPHYVYPHESTLFEDFERRGRKALGLG
jgi:hypothetical protein